jgi:dihydroorotate dehydrogenase electron transfer subunit
VEYRVATEDGSLGAAGRVTELLPELLPWSDVVFACGPNPMLQAVTEYVRDPRRNAARPKPTWVAMEEHMGCAMGVCRACVIVTERGNERVCREGPVFSLGDVRFERGEPATVGAS